jgi:hypothetical protein
MRVEQKMPTGQQPCPLQSRSLSLPRPTVQTTRTRLEVRVVLHNQACQRLDHEPPVVRQTRRRCRATTASNGRPSGKSRNCQLRTGHLRPKSIAPTHALNLCPCKSTHEARSIRHGKQPRAEDDCAGCVIVAPHRKPSALPEHHYGSRTPTPDPSVFNTVTNEPAVLLSPLLVIGARAAAPGAGDSGGRREGTCRSSSSCSCLCLTNNARTPVANGHNLQVYRSLAVSASIVAVSCVFAARAAPRTGLPLGDTNASRAAWLSRDTGSAGESMPG